MNTLVEQLNKVQSNVRNELREQLERIEKCEKLGNENTKKLERLDKTFNTELSKYYSNKQEESIPYIFDAPDRNPYFSGRSVELEELQRISKLNDAGLEGNVCIGAVCGLGGIGKTSLVAEYAHNMKNYYQGGVYWFSAEDENFFEKSVNETALKLGALLQTFDLTLTNTLMKIAQTSKPCLIVLDCLDQLEFSPHILKFISRFSKQKFPAAIVMITRRNESKLVDEISCLHKERCLSLKCLEIEEAKQFICLRTGVIPDDKENMVSQSLAEELGGLPLALEQAGACIKSLGCSLSDYLEQFRNERLKLLRKQKAMPVSLYESSDRLAVHTTWLLNIKHIKDSPDGIHAIRLMNAYTFFNPSEIEQELVNAGERPIENKAFRDCVSSPLGPRQVVKLLTDFSLFMFVHAHSVSIHRLVQELVWDSLDPEEKVESFVDAVRLLSFAFSNCPSPRQLSGNVSDRERFRSNDSPYFLWSKLCYHGFYLRQKIEKMLLKSDLKSLNSQFGLETSRILCECVFHLSAYQKQDEAKRCLNFAYRILDWISIEECEIIKTNLSNNTLFPAQIIPLRKWLQILIKKCCVPPVRSLEYLDQKPQAKNEDSASGDLKQTVEKFKLKGNEKFKEGLFKEAVDAYSTAVDMSVRTPFFDPFLLTNRASAYIKLNQLEKALKDANEYITRFPICWKGYARKALALDEKVSAEIAAALAYYYFHQNDGRCIFLEYKPFIGAFQGLKERIVICQNADQLNAVMDPFRAAARFPDKNNLPIVILMKKKYVLTTALCMINCIIVGAKPNSSVTLKFVGKTCMQLFRKCMLANLSFDLDMGQVNAQNGSWVKIHKCNFTSKNDNSPAVASSGVLNAERCTFTGCKAGGLLCEGPGEMAVEYCSFSGNVKAGLEVRENGKLTARNSGMYNNHYDGILIGPSASECNIFRCDIYHNAREGISVVDASHDVSLIRNDVFENGENGVFVRNSEVNIKENKFHDNERWGIWSQTNSWCNVSMNDVFRNKCGGVRLGKRLTESVFPQCEVELNQIHDNLGSGYVEDVHYFEHVQLFLRHSEFSKSAKYGENELYDNKDKAIVNQSKLSILWCSGCMGHCDELKRCGMCFTSGYCDKNCQERHWSKHKKLCQVFREKSSFLIKSMKRHLSDRYINVHSSNLKEVGPDCSDPPPRNGKRFIVKVQSDFEHSFSGQPHLLTIYDRSLDIYEDFEDEFIDHLVREFGVLCERKYQEKKLFFKCVFENDGKLRLFINDFADFQKW